MVLPSPTEIGDDRLSHSDLEKICFRITSLKSSSLRLVADPSVALLGLQIRAVIQRAV